MKKWFLLVSIGIMGAVHAADEAYVWENALTLESVHNFSGGIDEESAELANLDVTLAIDTATAGWWENGEVFIYALGDYGKDPAELTGGVQGTSNIAADDAIKIYEFWYQHSFANDSFKILTGLHDFNSTFYSLDSAGLFNYGDEINFTLTHNVSKQLQLMGKVARYSADEFAKDTNKLWLGMSYSL